jgi:hypothetical protein
MASSLAPYHLFKITIGSDDNTLVTNSPVEDIRIAHLGVLVRHFYHVIASFDQSCGYSTARVNINPKPHLSCNPIVNGFACNQVMRIKQGRAKILRF